MKKITKAFCLAALAALIVGCGERVGTAYVENEKEFSDSEKTTEADTEPTTGTVTEAAVNSNPPEEAKLIGAENLEVYSTVTLESFIANTDVQLSESGLLVDTNELGSHDITVQYTYNGIKYEQTLSYNVEDTTPPVILNGGYKTMAEVGKAFDLNDYVGFADNYDSKPTLTYTGSVDTSAVGIYPLTATVKDSSGNQTTWELTVNVLSEIPVPEDNNSRLSFETFAQEYGGENVRLGIDVSKWQGDIDFQAVKDAGCSFVIMRIGSYYGENDMDAYYKPNIEGAKAAGLDVGVYFYTTANSEESVRSNAEWIAEQLGGEELDFPIAFDWESFSTFQEYGMSIHDLNSYFELFSEEMKKYGYDSMLYSSKNFLNNFWSVQNDYPVWLAHYTDETDYTGDYSIWQMSCFGRIPGIAGDVDFNILYTDMPI